ncbi:unnamed protein product [Psylliodes chrysocephalus]|uniref:CCHC-type domain-containing protein n=1 Tax=Psylliodes chrysocephalus TaxID=3402493 RepID=A0A9P0CIP0_9CUCU|nr:unnamed protein product [Psylliodes chrysocephala]
MSQKNQTQLVGVSGTETLTNTAKSYQNNSVGGTQKNSPASQEKGTMVPRFLLVKRKSDKGENFEKVSPFLISKAIYGLIGETNSLRKIKDGLLIHTKSNSQASRLLQTKTLIDFEVEVIPHGTLNISKGIVFCKDLLNCTTEEILENLKDEGVIEFRRMKKKVEGVLIDTANHILTFNNPKLPNEIKIAYYNLKIRPYIPPPTRCYNCQKFGHVSARCIKEKLCPCGSPPHEDTECTPPFTCVNCEGSHLANDRECPKYKTESAIIKIKIIEKIPYLEAKRKVMLSTPTKNLPQVTIQQVLPELKQIIAETIDSELQKHTPTLPVNLTNMSPPRYPKRTKRIRSDSSDIESVTSETTNSQTERKKKKTRLAERQTSQIWCDEYVNNTHQIHFITF